MKNIIINFTSRWTILCGSGILLNTFSIPKRITSLAKLTGQAMLALLFTFAPGMTAQSILTEDFESFTLCGPGGCNVDCGAAVVNGFVQDINGTDDDQDWRVHLGQTPSSTTGPAVDHTSGTASGKYLYTEASGCNLQTSNLLSPSINLNADANPTLEFYYHMYGSNMGTLNLDISTDAGASWTNLWTQSGLVQLAATDPWEKVSADLSAYSSTTIVLRWQGITGNGTSSDMAIDDIEIYNRPSNDMEVMQVIPPDQGLTSCSYGPTETIAAILINQGAAPATNFPVEYKINGGSTVTETFIRTLQPDSSTIFTFTSQADLSAIDTFILSVTTHLAGDSNPDNNVDSVSVSNFVISSFPHTEDFESFTTCTTASGSQTCAIDLSTGWFQDLNGVNDDDDWRVNSGGTPSGGTGPSNDHTLQNATGKYLYIESSFNGTDKSNFISPCLDISGQNVAIEFFYHMFGVGMGSLNLDISTDKGISWTNLWTHSGQLQLNSTDPWEEAIVSLDGYTGIVNLRFQGIAANDFRGDVAIDDVRFFKLPANNSIAHVDVSATGANDGTSWTDAFTSLQAAIENSSTDSGPDTIFVAQGIYKPSKESDGTMDSPRNFTFYFENKDIKVFGGYDAATGLRDISAHKTILSGDLSPAVSSDSTYHIVTIRNVSSAFEIDGFILTGGNADGSFPNERGAAIFNNGDNSVADPTILNCTFYGNTGGLGVAIMNEGNSGQSSPNIWNCVFHNNTATTLGGAAIFNHGSSSGQSNPDISNCTFYKNTAQNGGAIMNFGTGGTSHSLITNCIFWNNTATGAGSSLFSENATASISYSLVQEADCMALNIGTGPFNNSCVAGMKFNIDPMFADPDNMATCLVDLRLLSDSPAIEAGSAVGIATDADGYVRPIGNRLDMGAYEFLNPPCVIDEVLISPLDDYTSGAGVIKVANTITAINKVLTTATTVDYDAGVEINLNAGFEAQMGAVFHAFIQGCIGQE